MTRTKAIIIVICVFVLCIVALIFENKIFDTKDSELNDSFLIEKSYINFAWDFTYEGKVIDASGNIYSWNTFDKNDIKDVSTKDTFTVFLKNKATLLDQKVSSSDLKKIKEYIKSINEEDYADLECRGADQGSKSIVLYKERLIIKLSESGDCNGTISSKEAEELIKIVDKYL